MPIYEYRCEMCGGEFQRLILKREEEEGLQCPVCTGDNVKKLVSRVAYHVSEQDRLSTYDPGSPKDDAFFKDSRNIGLSAKKRAQRMGVDLGSDFEAKLDRLRTDPGTVFDDKE